MASSQNARLDAVDWAELYPRLLKVARYFHGRALRSFPGAPEPQDLAQKAIADLLEGRRTLPNDVPVFNTLCGIMRSITSNFVARQQPVGQPVPSTDTRFWSLSDHPDLFLPAASTPAPAPDAQVDQHFLRKEIHAHLGDHPLDREIVDLLLDDPALKPADLAALLDISVKDVYNAKRRLRRKLDTSPLFSNPPS